jgi:Mg-chelatase subunit ChlD
VIDDDSDRALRWRMVLGRHAEDILSLAGSADEHPEAAPMDAALTFVYDRAHAERAHRQVGGGGAGGFTVPAWLSRVRTLFPAAAARVVERDALVRYGLKELVTDPRVLQEAEPTEDLVKAILQFKHLMTPEVREAARAVISTVVTQLAARLETKCEAALLGASRDPRVPPRRTARNVDWHRTIRSNLARWDAARKRLSVDRVRYHHRQRTRGAWRIIVAVDQSGSMLDSLLHAAVLAAILTSVPAIDVRLVLWDDRFYDLSHLAHDPLEVLTSIQLGGGTRLLPALTYCSTLVTEPARTALVVVSDFHLSGDSQACLELAADLAESGVKGVGILALDGRSRPVHDERFARALAGCGWFVASLGPEQLADHLGRYLSG